MSRRARSNTFQTLTPRVFVQFLLQIQNALCARENTRREREEKNAKIKKGPPQAAPTPAVPDQSPPLPRRHGREHKSPTADEETRRGRVGFFASRVLPFVPTERVEYHHSVDDIEERTTGSIDRSVREDVSGGRESPVAHRGPDGEIRRVGSDGLFERWIRGDKL